MKAEELNELEELCKNASAGPWTPKMGGVLGPTRTILYENSNLHLSPADMTFIAASREAMPKLIEEVRTLQCLVGNYHKQAQKRAGQDPRVPREGAKAKRIVFKFDERSLESLKKLCGDCIAIDAWELRRATERSRAIRERCDLNYRFREPPPQPCEKHGRSGT